MVKSAPRNEAQFIAEIRESLNLALSDLRVEFTRLSEAGRPDYRLDYIRKSNKKLMSTVYAEFKYSPRQHTALIQPWNMLRKIQQVTMLNMANAGLTIALVVCEAGKFAPWYIFDPVQVKRALSGQAPLETVLALRMLSKRLPNGSWSTGTDWGEEDEGPKQTIVDKYIARVRQGLIKPSRAVAKRLGLLKNGLP